MPDEIDPQTTAVHAGRPDRTPDAPLSVPPVLSSTYHAHGATGYGRYGNPTWTAFEDAVGALEGGRAVAFSSGTAAVAAALSLVDPGARVMAPGRDAYGGTRELLEHLHDRGAIDYVPVESWDTDAVLEALDGAALLWVETPTNPLVRIADLPALAAAARAAGAMLVVDSTFATPLLLNPLAAGADIVIHSVTKFIGGHSDVLLGVAATSNDDLIERFVAQRSREGAIPGPLETFLALRGLRTLGVRLERAQTNADLLARRLVEHDAVDVVHYPGLESHPDHDRALSGMRGFGAMLSFEVADAAAADAVCDAARLIVHTTSLGGVETSMERRTKWAAEMHLPPGLIRVSAGIENGEDLWRDLAAALEVLSR